MKTRILSLVMTCALLSACASQPPVQAGGTTKPAAHAEEDESGKPPTIGMTKAQVRARYGDPKRESTTDEGETWIYVLNLGSVLAKSAIPFYFGGRAIKTGSVTFGPDGKVKKFNWDTQAED